jgi:predicted component of type VI protein secretion system
MKFALQLSHRKKMSLPRLVPLIAGQPLSVGREPTNSIHLPDVWVSRIHCVFLQDADGVWVKDTSIAGLFDANAFERIRRQDRPRKGDCDRLFPGEVIWLGDYQIQLVSAEPDTQA